MPDKTESPFNPETKKRVKDFGERIQEHLRHAVRRLGDENNIQYVVDERTQMTATLTWNAGGYWTRYGESTWIEVASPDEDKIIIGSDYEHPADYSESIYVGDEPVRNQARADALIEYAEQMMDFVEADVARQALLKRRSQRYPLSLDVRRDLEIDQLAYDLSAAMVSE